MKKQMDLQSIQHVASLMVSLTQEYPKAKIVFDLERGEVLATYPLPKDYTRFYEKSEYPC